MGFGSYLGPNSYVVGNIGRFTSIAPFVRCNSGVHPYKLPYVTTSPSFYSLNLNHSQNGSTFAKQQMFKEHMFVDNDNKWIVNIGHDCWIGEHVFMVGGVTVNNGAVVLAHAVVTKDVPPYAIVGGIPAKVIGYRYDEETIAFFYTKISTAIRDDIETYLFDNKYELKNEAGTVTDCYKLSNGNYIAHCQLKEGDTTLIELNLNVPVEEQAEIICARWRENSQEVYDYIVRKLM